MANPTHAHSGPHEPASKRSSRVVYYVVLALVTIALLFVARILGMPRGVGIEHEPAETSPAPAPSAPR